MVMLHKFFITPPFIPVKTMAFNPNALATFIALTTFLELPEVLSPTAHLLLFHIHIPSVQTSFLVIHH